MIFFPVFFQHGLVTRWFSNRMMEPTVPIGRNCRSLDMVFIDDPAAGMTSNLHKVRWISPTRSTAEAARRGFGALSSTAEHARRAFGAANLACCSVSGPAVRRGRCASEQARRLRSQYSAGYAGETGVFSSTHCGAAIWAWIDADIILDQCYHSP